MIRHKRWYDKVDAALVDIDERLRYFERDYAASMMVNAVTHTALDAKFDHLAKFSSAPTWHGKGLGTPENTPKTTELDASNTVGFSKAIFIHLPDDLVVAVNDFYELARVTLAWRDAWRGIAMAAPMVIEKARNSGARAELQYLKCQAELCDFLDDHPEFRRITALQAKDTDNGTE